MEISKEKYDSDMLAKDLRIRNMEIQINKMKNCGNCGNNISGICQIDSPRICNMKQYKGWVAADD